MVLLELRSGARGFFFSDAEHAACRFSDYFTVHLAFLIFAFALALAFYLNEGSSAMSSFGRDVMVITSFCFLSRLEAQRVSRRGGTWLLHGWYIGSASWTLTNIMGWTSFTYHLHRAGDGHLLSVELTVVWATAHLIFASTLVLWPAPRVCEALLHPAPFVANVLAPDYMPLCARASAVASNSAGAPCASAHSHSTRALDPLLVYRAADLLRDSAPGPRYGGGARAIAVLCLQYALCAAEGARGAAAHAPRSDGGGTTQPHGWAHRRSNRRASLGPTRAC